LVPFALNFSNLATLEGSKLPTPRKLSLDWTIRILKRLIIIIF
jgi:hypothetical protein